MVSLPFWVRGGLIETVRGEEGCHSISTLLAGLKGSGRSRCWKLPLSVLDAVVDSWRRPLLQVLLTFDLNGCTLLPGGPLQFLLQSLGI